MEVREDLYLEKGKEILKLFINNGCDACFIGEVVRAKILAKPYKIIEIYTSASSEVILGLFSKYKIEVVNDSTYKLVYYDYEFLICVFKTEVSVDLRRPIASHYSKNLIDFLERSDFTINALALSHSGKITDCFSGYKDLKKKKIKVIGKPKLRFNENPVRMLRALRLVSELGFRIESKTLKAMSKNKCLNNLSLNVIAMECAHIIRGPNFKYALAYILSSKIYKRLPIYGKEFKRLGSKYKKVKLDQFLAYALVKNGEYNEIVGATADDPAKLKKTVELALVTPKSNYDPMQLFMYGEELCVDANEVNNTLGKAKKKIRKIKREYNNLPIKKTCDLEFKGQDVLEITKDTGGDYLIELMDDITAKVLCKEIANNYEILYVYALSKLKEMGIIRDYHSFESSKITAIPTTESPEALETPRPIRVDGIGSTEESAMPKVTTMHEATSENEDVIKEMLLKQKKLEERIETLEKGKLYSELEADVEQLLLKNNIVLDGVDSNQAKVVDSKLKKVYREILIETNPKYNGLKVNEDED